MPGTLIETHKQDTQSRSLGDFKNSILSNFLFRLGLPFPIIYIHNMKTYYCSIFIAVLLTTISNLNAQSRKSIYTIIPMEFLPAVVVSFESFASFMDKVELGQITLYKDDSFVYEIPDVEIKKYIYRSDTITLINPNTF